MYLLLSILHAQECDTSKLVQKLMMKDADVPDLFLQLHDCDSELARAQLPSVLSSYTYDEKNEKSVSFFRTIIYTQEAEQLFQWLQTCILHERQQILFRLAELCVDDDLIRDFFLKQATTAPIDFWLNRWDIPLRECPHPDIVNLFHARISRDVQQGDSRFWGILTSYAIVAREKSIPVLVERIEKIDPAQRRRYFDIFTHIMIASESEEESDRLLAAIKASIFSLSVLSEGELADRARQFFLQFGDVEAANATARFRYQKALQDNYALIWGGMVIENVVCANNIARQNIHTALLIDTRANKWKEHVEKLLVEQFQAWGTSLATECKGKGSIDFYVSAEPLMSEEDFAKWIEKNTEKAHKENVSEDNRKTISHGPIGLD